MSQPLSETISQKILINAESLSKTNLQSNNIEESKHKQEATTKTIKLTIRNSNINQTNNPKIFQNRLNQETQPKQFILNKQGLQNHDLFPCKNSRQIDRMGSFQSYRNLQLDPRDEKIQVKFKSSSYPDLQSQNFSGSMQEFQNQLRDWLVDVIEITTSIGYNHLNKKNLTEKQTKSFVVKNILQNIKEVLENYKEIPLEKRYELMKFLNQESLKIFDHIAKKYPQTRSRGVSKRIKSKVTALDNREDNQFDFLLKNNINIQYREDGDYSEDIMSIINKLISFSTQVYDPSMELEESNYEVFCQIMEYIFQNSICQTQETTVNEVASIINKKKHKIQKEVNKLNSHNGEDKIKDSKQFSRTRDVQKQVKIGKKIPSGVPLFSQEDIEASRFKINDSSILRILTKWANELREKIDNAEQTILQRRFKFKTNKGKLMILDAQMKSQLYKAAMKQIKVVQKELNQLKEENYYLQTIFSEQSNQGKYSKHDTKVGIFAAKLNQIASQYIFKYLNKLIHSLLTISKIAAKSQPQDIKRATLESVNLVTFKIGDMMRSKCSCPEQQFLKILKAIQSIHHHEPDIMKISRIKNRLQTDNNDVSITFFFGQKAECQLQLSILSSQKKEERNRNTFNHLIYEILRAELGPLSEMASIMVQYDPLAYFYSQQESYAPELLQVKKSGNKPIIQTYDQKLRFTRNKQLGTKVQLPFVCCNCQNLAIVHNPEFFYRDLEKGRHECNGCLKNSFSHSNPNKYKLRDYVLGQIFGEDTNKIAFISSHTVLWDPQQLIQEMRKETSTCISSKWFPTRGYAIRYNQKRVKEELFTYIFQQTSSTVIFANINKKGEKNILLRIKIHEDKEKKIKNIQQQFKKFAIFQIYDIEEKQQNGEKLFVCNKPNCCGKSYKPGPIFERSEAEEFIHLESIKKSTQGQNSLLYLNSMPRSLEKLQTYLESIKQKNKLWKVRNSVQAIEAFQCKVENIRVVGVFVKLQDLNIGDNNQLKSLKGIQNCLNLKYLNCSNCDLTGIQELQNLKKLQILNFTNNRKLTSINQLSGHSQLQELILKNTAVKCLAPLEECLKLECLDMQGCHNITSVKEIKSPALSYISIINCRGLQTFDLSAVSLQSLTMVDLSRMKKRSSLAEDDAKDVQIRVVKRIERMQQKNINFDNFDVITKINDALGEMVMDKDKY